MEVNIDRIKKDIDAINTFNSTSGQGITRLTFTSEYMKAYNYVIDELIKIGAEVTICRAGCIRGRIKGSDLSKKTIMTGSHIDTVPNGGQFDGQVGTFSALEVARVIVEKNVPHSHSIDVVVFPEEEGARFGIAMGGSSAWTNVLEIKKLNEAKDKRGITYHEAMKTAGIKVENKTPLMPGEVKAMLEVHIEQSTVLDREGLSVGIIESIAGARLYNIVIEGKADHAGGTPMKYRNDALQGAVRVIAAVEDIAANQMGSHTVGTCGYVRVEPGAMNVIPGRVSMTLDLRDSEVRNLERMPEKIKQIAKEICSKRGLNLEMSEQSGINPVKTPKYLVNLITECAKQRGIKTKGMMSGALHDSCKLAKVTDIGMIFVPSKEGRSHCREEWTDWSHIKDGANVLLDTIITLSR